TLKVGRHHRLQLLHHTQTSLNLRHYPRLLGKGWERDWHFTKNGKREPKACCSECNASREVAGCLAIEVVHQKCRMSYFRVWRHLYHIWRNHRWPNSSWVNRTNAWWFSKLGNEEFSAKNEI